MIDTLKLAGMEPLQQQAVTTGVVAALILLVIMFGLKSRGQDNLPGPPSIPLLGNTIEVTKNLDRILEWWVDCARQYGGKDMFTTWKFEVLGQPKFVVNNNPKNVERILTEVDIYGKGPIWRRK